MCRDSCQRGNRCHCCHSSASPQPVAATVTRHNAAWWSSHEAAICMIHTRSVTSCFLLCLAGQYAAHMAKVDKHVWEVHMVAIEAQQLLSTHLMCGSLACGARHAAKPRKHTRACFGHIRWGVRGVVRAVGFRVTSLPGPLVSPCPHVLLLKPRALLLLSLQSACHICKHAISPCT